MKRFHLPEAELLNGLSNPRNVNFNKCWILRNKLQDVNIKWCTASIHEQENFENALRIEKGKLENSPLLSG